MWKEDDVVGVGVVGYGYLGPNLARNFAEAEAAQLVAVCDMDPAKLGLAKRRHPAAVIAREFRIARYPMSRWLTGRVIIARAQVSCRL